MNNILILIGLTLLPVLELRGSIPYGIFKTDLHWSIVFIICIIANIMVAPLSYFIYDKIIHIFLKIKVIDKYWNIYIEKTRKNIKKYVDKYGEIGLAIFIGIPLPGSGVYSGVLGGYLVGMSYKKILKASIIGVLIAGVIVLTICLTGVGIFKIFVKVT